MIQQEQSTSDLSVETGCAALEVSPSDSYAWCERDSNPRQEADAQLGDEIERVFIKSRRIYGSHRVWLALGERGIRTSRKRVERLRRQPGLRSIRARKPRIGRTKAGQSAYFAPNLLHQAFEATAINEKWVTDTTYIPTHQGWLYLVSVMDLFNRQIVGWALGDHHDADRATSALDMAIRPARPAAGLIVHSDRGSEFANPKFHRRATTAKIRLSMSSTGNCYDNAAAESFFAPVKLEAIPEGIFASRQQARMALFDYIEVFYNRERLHSGIDGTTASYLLKVLCLSVKV
jgi:putative transposase